MSDRVRNVFIVVLSTLVVLLIPWFLTFYFDHYHGQQEMLTACLYVVLVWIIIYAITSAFAVYLFVRKLLRLAVLQTSTLHTNALNIPSMNKQQTQMIELSTKYLTLFLFAMVSTLLSVAAAAPLGGPMVSILIPVDMCVNAACLFLQYPFAQAQYNSLCSQLDSRIGKLLEQQMKRAISSTNTRHDGKNSVEAESAPLTELI